MTDNHSMQQEVEQALIITIPLRGDNGSHEETERWFKLEDQLINAIESSKTGEHDGNEIGEGTFTIYVYGPSADKLLNAVLPVLAGSELPPGSQAIKRYGKPGAKQQVVSLAKGAAN